METIFAAGAFFSPRDIHHKDMVEIQWRVTRIGPEGPNEKWVVHFGTTNREFATRSEAWGWLSLFAI